MIDWGVVDFTLFTMVMNVPGGCRKEVSFMCLGYAGDPLPRKRMGSHYPPLHSEKVLSTPPHQRLLIIPHFLDIDESQARGPSTRVRLSKTAGLM